MHIAGQTPCSRGRGVQIMRVRWGCVAVICLGLASQAEAAEHSGLIHRASCSVVRFYVAKFSAYAAEAWARNQRATKTKKETTQQSLRDAPSQSARATTRWVIQ